MIKFLKRLTPNDENEMHLIINEKNISILFCSICGNYMIKNSSNKYLHCFHDERIYLYKIYREVIENFETYTSGDAFDEYILYPENICKFWKYYIYNIVLFGLINNKNYQNRIDDNIKENILSYII